MFVNPYGQVDLSQGKWLKANFHLHAGTKTDPYDIGEVISMYKQAGYEILMVSNQHVFTDTAEYAEKHGMLLINGIEYMEQEELLCMGLKSFVTGSVESVVDQCIEQGGLVIACHPNYIHKGWWPLEKMMAIEGIIGLEIMNPVIFRVKGSGLATDYWDQLLSKGRLIWGFANDDFHKWYDFARAFTMIYSPSSQYEDIKESISKGCLYASTGLKLAYETLEGGSVKVLLDCGRIDYGGITITFSGEDGKILKQQVGDYGEYELSDHEKYVRVRAMAEAGMQLWTQPIYNTRFFRLKSD